jgi:hypothetical protein
VTGSRSGVVSVAVGAFLACGTATASPSVEKAGANSESHDLVHTEVTQDDTGTRQVAMRRRAGEYWLWDGKRLCVGEPGGYLYIDQPVPRPLGFKLPNPREVEFALYKRVVVTPSGGRIYTGEIRCLPLPEPPTPGNARTQQGTLTTQVEDWLRVPTPMLGLSPEGTPDRPGLTGAKTRFWTQAIGLWAPQPTTLAGTRVEVQAWPVEYRWDAGDGLGPASHFICAGNEQEPTVVGACGGTAAQPQVVHVYETKSSAGAADGVAYTVTLQVSWRARYRVVNAGGPGPWTPLADRQTEASRPYRVEEVRAVLVPE